MTIYQPTNIRDAEAGVVSAPLAKPYDNEIGTSFFQPMGARLVIKEDDHNYKGAIAIPEKFKQKPTTGVVVAIGPDVPSCISNQEPIEQAAPLFAHGDHVVYAMFAGTILGVKGGASYRIIGYDEILAKIPKDTKLELEAR